MTLRLRNKSNGRQKLKSVNEMQDFAFVHRPNIHIVYSRQLNTASRPWIPGQGIVVIAIAMHMCLYLYSEFRESHRIRLLWSWNWNGVNVNTNTNSQKTHMNAPAPADCCGFSDYQIS